MKTREMIMGSLVCAVAGAFGLAGCGAAVGTTTPSSGAAPQAQAKAPPTPATVSPTVAPAPTAEPSPTAAPPTAATAPTGHAHHTMAACRLLDPGTAAAIAGARVTKDSALSGPVDIPFLSTSDGTEYLQDDCAYRTGTTLVRIVLLQPAARSSATAADGGQAFQAAEADLSDHGITVDAVDGLGDQAAVATPGAGGAQVIVLDNDVVFDVAVETSADPEGKAVALAAEVLTRADSGTANGRPGS